MVQLCVVCAFCYDWHLIISSFILHFQLPIGRESIGHYRVMRRNPVFSHDELVCKLIMKPDQLELCLLNSTAEDAKRMVKEECMLRNTLTEKVCVYEIIHHACDAVLHVNVLK